MSAQAPPVTHGPAPRVRFDPQLIEAVVDLLLRRETECGDGTRFEGFRRAADRIYALYDTPGDRRGAFQTLYARVFEEMRCGTLVVNETVALAGQVEEVVVGRAWRPDEEGAELSADRRLVGLRVAPLRFASSAALQAFLRHEFGHVFDMLDETFRYGDGAATGRLRELTAARFGCLWDCVVDGRIARAGGLPLHRREDLEEECARLFPALSPGGAAAVVRRLWEGERPTYAALARWATDPGVLAAWAGVGPGAAAQRSALAPGAPCPLCGFPTYDWAPEIDAITADAIRTDFPRWRFTDGVCARCVEAYAVPAGGASVQVSPVGRASDRAPLKEG